MSNRRDPRNPNLLIDPRRAVLLDEQAGRRQQAQEIARGLLQENATMLKLLGALLERTGPLEVDTALLEDQGVEFEIEKYDSNDGLSARWVSKRVRG